MRIILCDSLNINNMEDILFLTQIRILITEIIMSWMISCSVTWSSTKTIFLYVCMYICTYFIKCILNGICYQNTKIIIQLMLLNEFFASGFSTTKTKSHIAINALRVIHTDARCVIHAWNFFKSIDFSFWFTLNAAFSNIAFDYKEETLYGS